MGGHRRRIVRKFEPHGGAYPTVLDRDENGRLVQRPRNAFDWLRHLLADNHDRGLAAARELRRLLEEHEARHVVAARRAGYRWDHIAYYLGVRRQTAHGKWARKLGV